MNINAFSSFSSPSSGEPLLQANPLENQVDLLSDNGQEQQNNIFSLEDLLLNAGAFNGNEEMLAMAQDNIELDPQMLENLSTIASQEGMAALLAYFANASAAQQETAALDRQPDSNRLPDELSPTLRPVPTQVSVDARSNPSVSQGLTAQGAAMPAANLNLTELLTPTPMLRTEEAQPEVTASKTPAALVKSLLDKTESTASSLPSLASITSNTQAAQENPIERSANWSTVKLQAKQENWSQQLHSVLNDRLQIQSDNRIQHATIRLDPPEMGKIDISLHMEGGKLQVQINASQNDVYKALQQISNELRLNLVDQNFTQVSVQIASSGQQQHQGQHRQMNGQNPEPEIANQSEAEASAKPKDETILTTA